MLDLIEKSASIGVIEKATDIASQPGTYYGFTAGACTGFALKKVAKAAAFTFGAVFMGFQLAAQTGYVTVNWGKVERDLKKYFPEKPADESQMISEAVKFLTTNTGIAATVFTAGFMTGLKMG
jgi:uncharacterized membrane protein (Fun14 family)